MPMLIIRKLNADNLHDTGQCDGTYWVEARLILSAENNHVRYTVARTSSPYEKRYPEEKVDYAAYLGQPDRAVFLAYEDGQVTGHIRLCQWWNRFGYVEDLVVDRRFRRRGIGRKLIAQAQLWAVEQHLPGLMLETQDNNVGGCQLYAQCGFELAGFDRRLYQGLHPGTEEIALYWYWIPETRKKDQTGPDTQTTD